MNSSNRSPIPQGSALGLVSTRSFPAIVGTADMMLKSAAVRLVGYEKTGSGYCTAVVRGNISDVRLAVEAGADVAEQFGQLISKTIIPRPMPNLETVLPISNRLSKYAAEQGYSRLSNLAIGVFETRGFPAMVGAAEIGRCAAGCLRNYWRWLVYCHYSRAGGRCGHGCGSGNA